MTGNRKWTNTTTQRGQLFRKWSHFTTDCWPIVQVPQVLRFVSQLTEDVMRANTRVYTIAVFETGCTFVMCDLSRLVEDGQGLKY